MARPYSLQRRGAWVFHENRRVAAPAFTVSGCSPLTSRLVNVAVAT
jgi:hypothetical protein